MKKNYRIMNRKYPEVKGYWLYSIKIKSNGKYYIGVSKQQCYQRWQKSAYIKTVIEPYLEEWESMEKTVIQDGLSKEEAYQYEGKIIDALSMNNLCINKQRSGLIANDINVYKKQYRENNPEYRERQKQRSKQYHEDNKQQIKEYKSQWQKQRYENDAEYRERKNQQSKQYRENNKEKLKEYNKQYYERKKLERKQQHTSLL